MAQYYLKYFAEIQNFRGQMARVEIHQRDTAPAAVLQIGDVCGLELEIQGSTEEIYVPIVKTQARLSMVSSDDKPTAGGIKYGDWGEFYTPDSSLYKFVLKTKPTAEASAWTTRWTGYITPDSWQEGLDYRSPITIIARDNIGHLQDFDFDMNPADEFGLASIRSILAAAMEKIDFPMDYITDSAPETLQADETDILDALVSISHFEGENWYSVVESILDSIGYTLRYTDNNRFTLAPVRYLPLLGETSEAAQREIADLEFFGGTGEIVPAVKKIIEEVNYDYESEVPLRIKAEHLWTAEKTYHCVVRSLGVRMPFIDSENAKYRNLTSDDGTVWKTGSSGNDVADLWKPGTPSLVTLAMEGENWNNYVFLAANGYDSDTENDHRAQTMQFNSATSDLTIRFYFHRHPVSILENLSQTEANGAVVLGDMFGRAGLAKVAYIIKITDNSNIIRFWNDKTKSWEETRVINEQEFDPETLTTDVAVPLGQCPDITGDCTIDFTFVHIEYVLTTQLYLLASDFNGCYARLSNVTIESNAVNLKSNAVRTINDEKYNVLINRKPEIAPLSRQVAYTYPANYPSALFYFRTAGDILPKPYPYAGNWSGITGTVKPLPVLIHQQLLCYRGANLWQLSGDCAPKERGLLYFDTILRYKNRRYIIKSGTMDFTTGTFGGAVLREFLEYDDIWDDRQQGDWSDTSNYNTIGGEVSGGGGSGAGAGSTGYYGGGGVNYFEEDGNGGIKLKDKYAGLWVPGYLANGGIGSDSESGGGIDLDRVWESLTNNTDKPDVKIHLAHIPDITISKVTGLADALAQAGRVKSVVGLTGEITRQQLNSQIATSSITSGSDLLATSGGVYTYVNSVLSSAIKYRGITTTALTDGATTNPIIIDGESFTASLGDEVIYGGKEFLFTGGKWQQLGDEESWALKTISITGTGYLTGGGTLEANRTIDIASSVKTNIENGATAYGWGNHASAGYLTGITSSMVTNALGYTPLDASALIGYATETWVQANYLALSGGTLTGDLRLKTGGNNYGSTLRFGDGDYAYLAEDEDDHMSIYASKGITFSTGSSYGITYGNGVLKWDANNDAWHLEGNLYVDGFLACGGIGSGDDGEISGEKTFLDVVTFADETTFEEASVFEAGLTSMGISIANVASYRRINCAADRLYIQQSVSQDLVLTNGNNSHTIVGGYVSPGNYKFYVNGTARASSWDTSSDRRLKDKIEDVCSDRALAVLMALRPKEWIWNEKNDYLCGRRGAGLVAQEVQNVLPFAVNDSGDYLSLNYTVLHAYEIAGWKNHEARIAELEKKISHV